MFIHPHNHSVFSTRDGMLKIEDMIKKSIENGEGFALTDHGSIGGWKKYADLAKKNNIKPIFGVELYVNPYRVELLKTVSTINNILSEGSNPEEKKELTKRRDELKKLIYHFIMIAKNEVGFYNIIQLVNDAYINYFYSKPLVDWDSILSMQKDKDGGFGVIVTTACLGGPLKDFYKFNKIKEAEDWVNNLKDYFKDDFYLEVQANDIEEQRELNKFIIELSKKTNTKIVIGSDAHYLEQKDSDTHQDLLLLQNKNVRSDLGQTDTRIYYENKNGELKNKKVVEGKEFRKGIPFDSLKVGDRIGKTKDVVVKIEETPRVFMFSTDKVSFKSYKELVEDIKQYHKELIPIIKDLQKNNSELDDKIENIQFNTDIKLPRIDDASKKFIDLIKTKVKEKGLTEKKYIERIKYELGIIKKFGFETYFLILYNVFLFAKEKNIGIGNGRGSVTSSLIAYILDLHNMDPFDERYNIEGECLPFERFLSLDKLYDTIFFYDENGNKISYLETDNVQIKRNDEVIFVLASEIKEGDEIIK